jgi:peroxiredoxin
MVSKFVWVILIGLFILNPLAIAMGKNHMPSDDVVGFTLPNLAGENISLSDFLGKKVVLLVFGASWCPHCLKEIPELKEIYEKFKDRDFVLLSIDIGESKKKVEAFVKENSLPYPVLLDEKSEAASSYKVYGIPTVFLIDRQGKIAFKGGAPQGFLARKIEELLK